MIVSRDPFAREELHKRRVHLAAPTPSTCSWCGSLNHTPSGRPYLFEYFTETDGGRTLTHRGLFCNVDCFREYYR